MLIRCMPIKAVYDLSAKAGQPRSISKIKSKPAVPDEELASCEQAVVFEEERHHLYHNPPCLAFVHHTTRKPRSICLDEQALACLDLLTRKRIQYSAAHHGQELRSCARGEPQ